MVSKEYLNHIWFVMHHSDDPKRIAMAVTCYLDESGTDQHSSQAVVAGLLMHRNQFLVFDAIWEEVLLAHKVKSPLHMKEFGTHGRHGHLNYRDRFNFFTHITNLINDHKIISIATTLRHEQYERLIHDKMKKYIGFYGICFMLCAHVCFNEARRKFYTDKLSFIMEAGNHHAEHVRLAHQRMMELKRETKIWINTGALAFESKEMSALQAADIIAWGVNRRNSVKGLGKGFQPINNIFTQSHIQVSWPDILLKEWSDSVMERRDPNYDLL